MICEEISRRLWEERDEGYADFQSRLMPGIPRERIIGVRTPTLRRLAGEYGRRADVGEFLRELPHQSYDEMNLHGLILAGGRDYAGTVAALAGSYGLSTISPSASDMNKSGDEVTVNWTIDPAYEVTDAKITREDGTVVKTLDAAELASGSYGFAYDAMDGSETLTITVAKKSSGGDTPVIP